MSDAIPVHLMTREAVSGYLAKLAPDGILVMHITNRYMGLRSVLAAIATAEKLAGGALLYRQSDEKIKEWRMAVEAVVLARSSDDIRQFVEAGWQSFDASSAGGVRAWTDDYSNIIAAILRYRDR